MRRSWRRLKKGRSDRSRFNFGPQAIDNGAAESSDIERLQRDIDTAVFPVPYGR